MWRAGAGGTRKKRRTAKYLGGVFSPHCCYERPLDWGEEQGSGAGQGKGEARTVPLAVSNRVGVRMLGERYTRSCQVPGCMAFCLPRLPLLLQTSAHFLGLGDRWVTWPVVQPFGAIQT